LEEWVATYNGTGNINDYGKAIAIDLNGNVIICGESWEGGPYLGDYNYRTNKYTPTGALLWSEGYEGIGYDDDIPHAVCVDADGNIYVTGESFGSGSYKDYLTIKYSALGIQQWAARYNGTDNIDDKAYDIAVDSQGNVFVTGYSYGITSQRDYLTIKYSPDGHLLWEARYNGADNYWDEAAALALDSLGNVYVTGYNDGGGYYEIATLKYDQSGNQIWVNALNLGNDSFASDIALDNDANVYISGKYHADTTYLDYMTIKLNTNGDLQWIEYYNNIGESNDQTTAIAVDQDGSVFVTGYSEGMASDKDYATLKYDTNGILQWVSRYNGPANGEDVPNDLVLDSSGNLYVTGSSVGVGVWYEFATIKYDGDGNIQWISRYQDISGSYSAAEAIAIDGNNNVITAGTTTGPLNNLDFAVVKYQQTLDEIDLSLSPFGIPIQIPASGGTLCYEISIINGGAPLTVDVWADVTLPNGTQFGPVVGPISIDFPAGFTLTREREQTVPGGAPAGIYNYNVYIGDYQQLVWSVESFQVEKLDTGEGTLVEKWSNVGESLEVSENVSFDNVPREFSIVGVAPNPFNPTTTITYDLPEATEVNLAVFDVSGQQITTLVDGWRNAGSHQITFDSSNLSSGVYFYRLQFYWQNGVDEVEISGAVGRPPHFVLFRR